MNAVQEIVHRSKASDRMCIDSVPAFFLDRKVGKIAFSSDLKPSLQLYPNPSDGQFFLNGQNLSQGESVIIRVYNVQGQVALERKEKFYHNMPIDLSYLADGFYTLSVLDSQGISTIKIEIVH